MDTGTPTRDSFAEAKKYSSVRFIGSDSRDLMDWELNELQKILATDRKNITDQILKDGAVIFELGATVGLPQPGIAVGDDSAECSGVYQGTETQTYTVTISTGGAPGVAKFNYETSGSDVSAGEVTITAFDIPIAVGTLGVYISFTDGGDGVLTAGDSWIIPCTFGELLPTVDGNTLSVPSLRVYCRGRMEPVDGAELEYAAASSGYDYVWLEWMKYKVTYDDDATLVNPDTGEPVAQREKVVCTLKIEDTSGDALPTGAEERHTYQLYRWDRATDEVTRVIERYSKLDLNRLDGMLDATKVLQVGLNEELKGLLARRTDDESGSYLVSGLRSFYDSELTTDLYDSGDITEYQKIVSTLAGRAYVRGVQIDSDGENKAVDICLEYDAVQNEPHIFAFGERGIAPSKCVDPGPKLPLESITSLSGPVRICEEVTRGAIPGGSDSLGYSPLNEILAVTAASGVGGAAPASLTAPLAGPYLIRPQVDGGGAWTYPDDPYLLEIEVGEYGSINKRTLRFHLCGSPDGGWTVDEICDALNKGKGPAYWGYSSDSAPYNVIFENSGGKLKISSLTCGGWAYVKITENSAIAPCFGWTGGEENYGSGATYLPGTDYIQSGDQISWSPGGSEPATGTKFRIVYTYIKTFAETTDYVIGGQLGSGGGGYQTYYYAVTAVNKTAKGEESEYSNILQISSNGAVGFGWTRTQGATHYNVYRGLSRDALKLIGRTDLNQWKDYGEFEGVIDYPYAEGIEGGQSLPSYKMSEIRWAGTYFRRVISFSGTSGILPRDGETVYIDYNYYLPRYVLRVMDSAGNIQDIIGSAEEDCQVPALPDGAIPLCKILMNYRQDPVVTNYDWYRVTMRELQGALNDIISIRDDLAEQQLLNAALLGETADINGIFIEAFADNSQMDEADDDHNCRILDGVLTLPQEVKQTKLEVVEVGDTGVATTAELKKRYAVIGYESEAFITQDQWSSFMRVNPYTAWESLAPTCSIVNSVCGWADEETRSAESTQWPVPGPEDDAPLRSEQQIFYFPAIELTITGDGFAAGKEVSATFAGRSVSLLPAGDTVAGSPGTVMTSELDADDAGGHLDATFTIPSGIPYTVEIAAPWKAKAKVVLTDEDGNSASAYYAVAAQIEMLKDHFEQVGYRNDPIAQIVSWEGESAVFVDKILLPLPEPEVASIPNGTVLHLLMRTCNLGLPDSDIVGRQGYIYAGREPTPGAQPAAGRFYAPGSNNILAFDDPIFLPASSEDGITDSLYAHSGDLAVCLLSNSAHIRAYVARLGEQGQNPAGLITDQPYRGGVLLSSADAVTWTPHQDADLRFTLYRCKFTIDGSRGTLAFATVGHTDATEIELIAPSWCPTPETSILWKYQVSSGVRRTLFAIEPNRPVQFASPQSTFILQCSLRSENEFLSPLLLYNSLQLISRKNLEEGGYVSATSFMTQDFDGVRVKVEQDNPAGTSQEIYVSNDDGVTWHQLTSDHLVETVVVDEDYDDYTYDFSAFAKANRKFKIKILQYAAAGNTSQAPKSRNLRVITYTT